MNNKIYLLIFGLTIFSIALISAQSTDVTYSNPKLYGLSSTNLDKNSGGFIGNISNISIWDYTAIDVFIRSIFPKKVRLVDNLLMAGNPSTANIIWNDSAGNEVSLGYDSVTKEFNIAQLLSGGIIRLNTGYDVLTLSNVGTSSISSDYFTFTSPLGLTPSVSMGNVTISRNLSVGDKFKAPNGNITNLTSSNILNYYDDDCSVTNPAINFYQNGSAKCSTLNLSDSGGSTFLTDQTRNNLNKSSNVTFNVINTTGNIYANARIGVNASDNFDSTTLTDGLTIQDNTASIRLQASSDNNYYSKWVTQYSADKPWYFYVKNYGVPESFNSLSFTLPSGQAELSIAGYYGIDFSTDCNDLVDKGCIVMRINQRTFDGGRVGIGSLLARSKLDVNGTLLVDNGNLNVTAPNNITTGNIFKVNNIDGVTGNFTILKTSLTKCNMNFTGGILTATSC